MNRLLLTKFTPQILRGAEHLGFNARSLWSSDSIGKERLAQMRYGLADLDIRRARVLELKTGRSIGELAVLGIQADAPPGLRARKAELIRDTLKLMREFDRIEQPRTPRPPRKADQSRLKKRAATTRVRAV